MTNKMWRCCFFNVFVKNYQNQEVKIHFAFSGENVAISSHTLIPLILFYPWVISICREWPDWSCSVLSAQNFRPTRNDGDSHGDQSNYDNAVAIGANDFVTKPVDFALLKEKIYKLAPWNDWTNFSIFKELLKWTVWKACKKFWW